MSGIRDRQLILQDRDRHLLRELGTLRFVDREQARTVADFASVSRVNARLLALVRAGFLYRVFIGSISGGRRGIYYLSRKGAAAAGVPEERIVRHRGSGLTASDPFLEHQLSVNHVLIAFKFGPARSLFIGWRSFRRPVAPGVRLIPDGYCEVLSARIKK